MGHKERTLGACLLQHGCYAAATTIPDRAMRLAPLAFALLLTSVSAPAAEPLTLAQAMADPDWIGPPVEDAWWRWDGQAAQYTQKRKGASIRDTWQVGLEGGVPVMLDGNARADMDAADALYVAAGGSQVMA